MYKTISIQQDTYQQLNTIASRLDKPKAQVIDALVKAYTKGIVKKQKNELQQYNKQISQLSKRVPLPKGTKIDLTDMDRDFALLKDFP